MSARDAYPVWVVMGSACVGTLLGGVAVWMAITGPPLSLRQRSGGASSLESGARAENGPEDDGPESGEASGTGALESGGEDLDGGGLDAGADRDTFDPGDSPLVRAIEATRGSVVSIEFGGAVRGAGVIYDERGLLLTNSHVIEGTARERPGVFGRSEQAVAVTARFPDGRARAARVLAADASEDLAILRLVPERSDESFSAAPLGYSASLRLGEQVFAVGSPVGFEATVASGIVSALERTEVLANRQLPVIQLDAAINFGNSGGPLFNLRGELVGIATARSSRGEGIGFAIPIDHIRLFLRALQEGKRGRSGTVGLELAPGLEVAATVEPLGFHSGIRVGEVRPDKPAAAAGLQPGDVVVAIRGRRHDDLDSSAAGRVRFGQLFGETIRSLLPGETLAISVVRPGAGQGSARTLELDLTVEAADEVEQAVIDAEELLGLYLDPEAEQPRIQSLVPGSAISKVPGVKVLEGARVVSLFHQDVSSMAELGAGLERLGNWSQGRGRRIAIAFESADGQRIETNLYPVEAR